MENNEIGTSTSTVIKLKSTERDCPRCEHVLYQNNKEQCYECLNCGYIDCGDDD
jgi:ribosomal protein S27AE